MCKDETTQSKRCGKHSFRLIGKQKTYFKGTLTVDFKPLQKTKNIEKKSIIPTFNKDRKCYTPAFTIPSLPLQDDAILKQEHERRVQENTQQISQIYIPKPRSRQKYCGVCRDYYEEYIDHIQMDKHLEKLRKSLFQSYIIQQAQKFKSLNTDPQIQLQKINNTQTSCQTIISSNEEDIVEACLNFN